MTSPHEQGTDPVGQVDRGRPRAAVVCESMFGNTAAVAGAIGSELRSQGFDVEIWDVEDAPAAESLRVDLLVVGAPTHAFSLSRPGTRADAVRQGADAARARTGIREWLTAAGGTPEEAQPRVVAFDTRVAKARHLPGSAARAAMRLGERHHLGHPLGIESFYVEDIAGPLLDGELDRAREYARNVSASVPRPS
jgi:hypothetical protein